MSRNLSFICTPHRLGQLGRVRAQRRPLDFDPPLRHLGGGGRDSGVDLCVERVVKRIQDFRYPILHYRVRETAKSATTADYQSK